MEPYAAIFGSAGLNLESTLMNETLKNILRWVWGLVGLSAICIAYVLWANFQRVQNELLSQPVE